MTQQSKEGKKEVKVQSVVPNWTFIPLPNKLHQPQQVVSHSLKKDENSTEKQHD